MFNKTVQGPIIPTSAPNAGLSIIGAPRNTLGALVTSCAMWPSRSSVSKATTATPATPRNYSNIGGVQTQANEYTLGYLVTPAHTIFDFQPFVSSRRRKHRLPASTPLRQPEASKSRHARCTTTLWAFKKSIFSSTSAFVQASVNCFFLAPDYGQNFLTIKQRTITSEPSVGFYLKF